MSAEHVEADSGLGVGASDPASSTCRRCSTTVKLIVTRAVGARTGSGVADELRRDQIDARRRRARSHPTTVVTSVGGCCPRRSPVITLGRIDRPPSASDRPARRRRPLQSTVIIVSPPAGRSPVQSIGAADGAAAVEAVRSVRADGT